jgi:hypothetical protein
LSKLAQLIAKEEGFYVEGSLPNRDQNPGDLRHSPHASHVSSDPNGIGHIDSVAHGWADLERQLQLYGERGLTLREAIYEFAPPSENNSEQYLEFVCNGLQCGSDIPVTEALKIL